MEFLTSTLWLTVVGLNLAAQMLTSLALYKFQSPQLTAPGQFVILFIYGYAIYHIGWMAVPACLVMYVFFLLFCNRIVFYIVR